MCKLGAHAAGQVMLSTINHLYLSHVLSPMAVSVSGNDREQQHATKDLLGSQHYLKRHGNIDLGLQVC